MEHSGPPAAAAPDSGEVPLLDLRWGTFLSSNDRSSKLPDVLHKLHTSIVEKALCRPKNPNTFARR